MPSQPNTIKLVLVGSSGVGKTSLRGQYISGHFSTGYRATIGTDFISKTVPHPWKEGESVVLQIWDTAGQERFSSLSSAFFRGADAVLLLFDINTPSSLEALHKWWDEFCAKCPIDEDEQEDFCCVVVGNKMDLDGEARVSKEEAVAFLDALVAPVYDDEDEEEVQEPEEEEEGITGLPEPTAVPPSAPPTPQPQPPPRTLFFNLPFITKSATSLVQPELPSKSSTPSPIAPVPPTQPVPSGLRPPPLNPRKSSGTTGLLGVASPHGTISSISSATSRKSTYFTPSSSFFDSYLSSSTTPNPVVDSPVETKANGTANERAGRTTTTNPIPDHFSPASTASTFSFQSGISGYESAVSTLRGVSVDSLAVPQSGEVKSGRRDSTATITPSPGPSTSSTSAAEASRERKVSTLSTTSTATTTSFKSIASHTSSSSSSSSGAKTITPTALNFNRSVSSGTNNTSVSSSSKGKGKRLLLHLSRVSCWLDCVGSNHRGLRDPLALHPLVYFPLACLVACRLLACLRPCRWDLAPLVRVVCRARDRPPRLATVSCWLD